MWYCRGLLRDTKESHTLMTDLEIEERLSSGMDQEIHNTPLATSRAKDLPGFTWCLLFQAAFCKIRLLKCPTYLMTLKYWKLFISDVNCNNGSCSAYIMKVCVSAHVSKKQFSQPVRLRRRHLILDSCNENSLFIPATHFHAFTTQTA